MSVSEEQELLLSQLVDGELPVDEANHLLAESLKDAAASERLRAMLRLRETVRPWRRQEPPTTVVALPSAKSANIPHSTWRLVSLATAVLLGGILVGGMLVGGGFYLGGRNGNTARLTRADARPLVLVTPEQRSEIAKAFSLHESVAGPLSWYAADDSTIQVAPAQKGEAMRQPIAVLLRVSREGACPSDEAGAPKTYVIVCRNSDAATIELPTSAVVTTVRLRLLPTATNGTVSLQYTIAADGSDRGPDEAALAGRRQVGLSQTALGQLALDDRLVNVDASAWVVQE